MAYGRRRGGGWKIRIAIALVIAAFSIGSYMCTTQQNPITGKTERVSMSVDDEIQMGLAAKPELVQQFGGRDADPQDQRKVEMIGAKLVRAVDDMAAEHGRENVYDFDFTLLADDETVNAFALPGGQVFMTSALYDRLQSEAQLAGVLGHEVGHVIERHGAERMRKMELQQGLVGAAGVAGGGADSARMAQFIGNFVQMSYGRGDELESDLYGVELMARAGYDPRAMFGVMDVLAEAGGAGGQPEFMSTHPKPANRKKYIEDVIAEKFPDGVPENLQR